MGYSREGCLAVAGAGLEAAITWLTQPQLTMASGNYKQQGISSQTFEGES